MKKEMEFKSGTKFKYMGVTFPKEYNRTQEVLHILKIDGETSVRSKFLDNEYIHIFDTLLINYVPKFPPRRILVGGVSTGALELGGESTLNSFAEVDILANIESAINDCLSATNWSNSSCNIACATNTNSFFFSASMCPR
jgi:hypothetical protein